MHLSYQTFYQIVSTFSIHSFLFHLKVEIISASNELPEAQQKVDKRFHFKSIVDDINKSLQENAKDTICKSNLSFPCHPERIFLSFLFAKLSNKRLVKIDREFNNNMVHETQSYIYNNNSIQQEIATPSYTKIKTLTNEVIITKLHGCAVKKDLNIPFDTYEVPIKECMPYVLSNTTRTRKTILVNLTIPSQKIIVDPFSKVNVTYLLFENINIRKYLLDF